MRLNDFEKRVVNHPVRFWIQDNIEAPMLLRMFTRKPQHIDSVLEIGCGFGNGISMIQNHFSPNQLMAIDYDKEMVNSARSKHSGKENTNLINADGSDLPFLNNRFDMVFNFAVFHHIPDWQKTVKETYRVLKPTGYFVIEDLYRTAICNPLSKRIFDHPQTNRFNHRELIDELKKAGFKIRKEHNLLNLAGSILAQK
ncbi:class I SAM-dependent methyltransferase [Shewanella sp. 202IG2-18]|uniref:class I SAM-dependent methyltransferase n=1 Tax=Parashewanella hymeniacidonis TaxID=2807618 RepID=UPI00195F9D63|nr:class I SAM-dependent methyltransferase [Parashewanella hymeniacidonis]MBM7073120.1 class I SAM-dependent methyltransferase [Parashewanella hymeniacidonis]